MNAKVAAFQKEVIESEIKLFTKLNLSEKLLNICSSPDGLKKFAEAFYYIRYKFYKLNFIIGTRCGPDETFWRGLVENLLEELGGLHGVSHNELYRRFLQETGIPSEKLLVEPAFTVNFNDTWESYAFEAPFEEVLAAIAVYEILDNPDYQLLLNLTSALGVNDRGLEFFKVHAGAVHFELFEDFANRMFASEEGTKIIEKSAQYVLQVQAKLWNDLLTHLEN
jgi:pyrroloquinoline quinone (PQQ) biosynthesis protein C